MNKLLAALIAGAFASVAVAQTAEPLTSKDRQNAVKATTEGSANVNTGQTVAKQQAVNVQKSKQAPKLSKEERAKIASDATKSGVNPENSSGTVATATMQKNTTAVSKTVSKPKGGKQQPDKELQKNATP